MKKISDLIFPSDRRIALVGHIHPDGDCLGALTAVFRYMKNVLPSCEVTVYTTDILPSLRFLTEGVKVSEIYEETEAYDLCISLDVSQLSRVPVGLEAFLQAKRTVCIDHHVTNVGFADENVIDPDASSTCEVLCAMMEFSAIEKDTAISLYTGIVHDSGVFRYDSTRPETLRFAAALMEKGIPFSKIIEESLSNMDYRELRIMGDVMANARLYKEEHFLLSYAPISLQKAYGVDTSELCAIVAELNETREADVVLFFYELSDGTWKGSLRSRSEIDVSKIASVFGGGGHRKAAGFSVQTNPERAALEILKTVKELKE